MGRKVVLGSKSILLGSEMGNAIFPLGLKLKLSLLGADELNLQSIKSLSCVYVISSIIPLTLKREIYFSGSLQQHFLNLGSLCSSKDRTPAMLLLACCNSHAGQQMINKSLLYNINKLSALLSVACCHQSKSCVSKALICESLFSYLAAFLFKPFYHLVIKTFVYFFNGTSVMMQELLP